LLKHGAEEKNSLQANTVTKKKSNNQKPNKETKIQRKKERRQKPHIKVPGSSNGHKVPKYRLRKPTLQSHRINNIKK